MSHASVFITKENKIDTNFLSVGEKHKAKRRLLGIEEEKYDTFDADFLSKINEDSSTVFVAGLDNIVDRDTYKFGFDTLFELVPDIKKIYSLIISQELKLSQDSQSKFSSQDCLYELTDSEINLMEFRHLDIIMFYSFHRLYDIGRRARLIAKSTEYISEDAERIMTELESKYGKLDAPELKELRHKLRHCESAEDKQDFALVKKHQDLMRRVNSGIMIIKNPIDFTYRIELSSRYMDLMPISEDYYCIHLELMSLYACILSGLSYDSFNRTLEINDEDMVISQNRLNKYSEIMRFIKKYEIKIENSRDKDTERAKIVAKLFDESQGKILISDCNRMELQLAIHNTIDIHSAIMLIDRVFTEAGYAEHLNRVAIFNGRIRPSYVFDINNAYSIRMNQVRNYTGHTRFNGVSDDEIKAYKQAIQK